MGQCGGGGSCGCTSCGVYTAGELRGGSPAPEVGGYFEQVGIVPAAYRPAGLTPEEIALARERIAAERAAREATERQANQDRAARQQAEREGRIYSGVSQGVQEVGQTVREGIRSGAETEQERIRAQRDEAIARLRREAEAEQAAIRRAELDRPLLTGYASTSSGSSTALLVGGVVALYLLTRKRGRR